MPSCKARLCLVALCAFITSGAISTCDQHYVDYFLHRMAADFFQRQQFTLEDLKVCYNECGIRRVEITFSTFRSLDIKHARILTVETVNQILKKINNDPLLVDKGLLINGHFCVDQLRLEFKTDNIFSESCDPVHIRNIVLDDDIIKYTTYKVSPQLSTGTHIIREPFRDAILLVDKGGEVGVGFDIEAHLNSVISKVRQQKKQEQQAKTNEARAPKQYSLEQFNAFSSEVIVPPPQPVRVDSTNLLETQETTVPSPTPEVVIPKIPKAPSGDLPELTEFVQEQVIEKPRIPEQESVPTSTPAVKIEAPGAESPKVAEPPLPELPPMPQESVPAMPTQMQEQPSTPAPTPEPLPAPVPPPAEETKAVPQEQPEDLLEEEKPSLLKELKLLPQEKQVPPPPPPPSAEEMKTDAEQPVSSNTKGLQGIITDIVQRVWQKKEEQPIAASSEQKTLTTTTSVQEVVVPHAPSDNLFLSDDLDPPFLLADADADVEEEDDDLDSPYDYIYADNDEDEKEELEIEIEGDDEQIDQMATPTESPKIHKADDAVSHDNTPPVPSAILEPAKNIPLEEKAKTQSSVIQQEVLKEKTPVVEPAKAATLLATASIATETSTALENDDDKLIQEALRITENHDDDILNLMALEDNFSEGEEMIEDAQESELQFGEDVEDAEDDIEQQSDEALQQKDVEYEEQYTVEQEEKEFPSPTAPPPATDPLSEPEEIYDVDLENAPSNTKEESQNPINNKFLQEDDKEFEEDYFEWESQ